MIEETENSKSENTPAQGHPNDTLLSICLGLPETFAKYHEQAGAAVPQASQGQVDTTAVRTITAPITLAPHPEAPPASKAAKKKMGTVQRYYREFKKAGMLGSLLTVMPKEKFPCIYQKNGTVTRQKWGTKCELTEDQFEEANSKGAGTATRGDDIFSVDYDGENPELGAIVDEACDRLGRISPKRERAGSNRFLREFMQDISDPVLSASSTHTFRDKEGNEHSVEFRGQGGICVLANLHKSGVRYTYKDDKDIPTVGLKNLSVVTNAMARSCEEWVIQKATEAGFEYVPKKSKRGGGSVGTDKPISDTGHHAGNPQWVFDALADIPCDEKAIADRPELVEFLHFAKVSLAGKHWDRVWDWLSNHPEATDESYVRKIWNGIHESRTGYSRFDAWARENGHKGSAGRDFDDSDVTAEQAGTVPDPKSKSALDKMVRNYAWVQQQERYMHLPTMEMVTATAVNAANTGVAEFGKAGTNSAAAQLHNHPHALKVVMTTYRPGQPTLIDDRNKRGILVPAVNQWRRSNVVPAKDVTDDGVRPWHDHVELIFGPLNGPAARHFLDWCAFALQRPGVKIGHALVIFGETHGTGKDTVFVPFFRAVGEHNVSTITPATLAEPWTYYLLAQLVRVEEMMNFKRGEVANKLKPMLTTPPETVTINEKNVKQYDIPNIQNWVMFTNHENAIPIEDTDRRYWVHRCLLDAPRAPAYYAALYAWYGKGGTEKVAGWLMQRDVSAFNPMAPPPDTDAKREMQEQSLPPAVRWVRTLIAEGGELSGRTVWTVPALLKEATKVANSDFSAPASTSLNHKSIASALKLAGFKQTHRARIDGADANVWTRDPSGEMAPWSPAQIRDRYEAEKAARVVRDQAA